MLFELTSKNSKTTAFQETQVMGRQSVSSLQLQIHLCISNKQVKFLLFAETRRVVFNQILRKSSSHLANGFTLSVQVDHIRVQRQFFRIE